MNQEFFQSCSDISHSKSEVPLKKVQFEKSQSHSLIACASDRRNYFKIHNLQWHYFSNFWVPYDLWDDIAATAYSSSWLVRIFRHTKLTVYMNFQMILEISWTVIDEQRISCIDDGKSSLHSNESLAWGWPQKEYTAKLLLHISRMMIHRYRRHVDRRYLCLHSQTSLTRKL